VCVNVPRLGVLMVSINPRLRLLDGKPVEDPLMVASPETERRTRSLLSALDDAPIRSEDIIAAVLSESWAAPVEPSSVADDVVAAEIPKTASDIRVPLSAQEGLQSPTAVSSNRTAAVHQIDASAGMPIATGPGKRTSTGGDFSSPRALVASSLLEGPTGPVSGPCVISDRTLIMCVARRPLPIADTYAICSHRECSDLEAMRIPPSDAASVQDIVFHGPSSLWRVGTIIAARHPVLVSVRVVGVPFSHLNEVRS
jgi:hypothetical protein